MGKEVWILGNVHEIKFQNIQMFCNFWQLMIRMYTFYLIKMLVLFLFFKRFIVPSSMHIQLHYRKNIQNKIDLLIYNQRNKTQRVYNKKRLLHFILYVSKGRFRRSNCNFLLRKSACVDGLMFKRVLTRQTQTRNRQKLLSSPNFKLAKF